MKVGSFGGLLPQGHAEFDSGQVGFIYATEKEIKENFQVKKLSKKILERAKKNLEGEVETYDQYLSGDVYGYKIFDQSGEEIDSVWGFYGLDAVGQESKSVVDAQPNKLLETVNVRGVEIKVSEVTPTGLGAGKISQKRIKEILKERGTKK